MVTSLSVVLPVLVAVNAYSTVSPAMPVASAANAPCLSREICGVPGRGTSAESSSVTSSPLGGVPVVVAVLSTVPESTSAWVRVYVAVAATDCPGCRVPASPGQAAKVISESPGSGSSRVMPVSVVLPELVTTKPYSTVSPAEPVEPSARAPVLSRAMLGAPVMGRVLSSSSVTGGPVGGFPVVPALLYTSPASTSAWVRVYAAVAVTDSPASSTPSWPGQAP